MRDPCPPVAGGPRGEPGHLLHAISRRYPALEEYAYAEIGNSLDREDGFIPLVQLDLENATKIVQQSIPKIHSPGIHSRHTTTTATRHGQSTSIRRGITPPSCPLRQDSERSISFRPLLPPFVSSCVCKPSVTELCLAFPTRSVRCLSGMLLLQLLSYPLVLPAAWTPGWVLRPPLRSMVFWPTSVPTVLMRRALSLA